MSLIDVGQNGHKPEVLFSGRGEVTGEGWGGEERETPAQSGNVSPSLRRIYHRDPASVRHQVTVSRPAPRYGFTTIADEQCFLVKQRHLNHGQQLSSSRYVLCREETAVEDGKRRWKFFSLCTGFIAF